MCDLLNVQSQARIHCPCPYDILLTWPWHWICLLRVKQDVEAVSLVMWYVLTVPFGDIQCNLLTPCWGFIQNSIFTSINNAGTGFRVVRVKCTIGTSSVNTEEYMFTIIISTLIFPVVNSETESVSRQWAHYIVITLKMALDHDEAHTVPSAEYFPVLNILSSKCLPDSRGVDPALSSI